MANPRGVTGPLLLLSLSLIAVGFVSRTPVRHIIQIAPILIALAGALRRARWAAAAALPLFAAWLLLMTLIWLWLLGLARVLSGRFTPAEITLTVIIGLSCLWGFAALRRAAHPPWPARIALWLLFAALQAAALWASTRPPVSHR